MSRFKKLLSHEMQPELMYCFKPKCESKPTLWVQYSKAANDFTFCCDEHFTELLVVTPCVTVYKMVYPTNKWLDLHKDGEKIKREIFDYLAIR